MKKNKLAVLISAVLTIGVTGCNDDGSDVFSAQANTPFTDDQPITNNYQTLYTQTTEPVLSETGSLIKDVIGNVLVKILDNGVFTNEYGMLLVDDENNPITNENGEYDLFPVSFPLFDKDGYLVNLDGSRITTNAGKLTKPSLDSNDDLIFDTDGALVVDIYNLDGTLFSERLNTYSQESGFSGKPPSFLISPDEMIFGGDGKLITDENGNALVPLVDENDNNVSSPDGNIIVDIVDPDTSDKTGEKGELIINPDGSVTVEPLPPVLIDENGYVVDGNGELVFTGNGELLKPHVDENGGVTTDIVGNVIVDVYTPDGNDTERDLTVSVDENGNVTINEDIPQIGINPDGILVVPDSGEAITDDNDNGGKPLTDPDGGNITTPDGNLVVEVVD
uniref:hypothetical protein n=1 Tax=Vibrio sonorensis TaxID=1004316 RepID=UPI000AF7B50A